MADSIETLRFSEYPQIETAFLATSASTQPEAIQANEILEPIISEVAPEKAADEFRVVFKGLSVAKAEAIREGIVGSLEAVAAKPEEYKHLSPASKALLETFRAGPNL